MLFPKLLSKSPRNSDELYTTCVMNADTGSAIGLLNIHPTIIVRAIRLPETLIFTPGVRIFGCTSLPITMSIFDCDKQLGCAELRFLLGDMWNTMLYSTAYSSFDFLSTHAKNFVVGICCW